MLINWKFFFKKVCCSKQNLLRKIKFSIFHNSQRRRRRQDACDSSGVQRVFAYRSVVYPGLFFYFNWIIKLHSNQTWNSKLGKNILLRLDLEQINFVKSFGHFACLEDHGSDLLQAVGLVEQGFPGFFWSKYQIAFFSHSIDLLW